MDNIERLDAFVIDKPIDMKVEEKATNYMDVDPTILILREENLLYHTMGDILLQGHAIWPQKCWCYLPTSSYHFVA